MRYDIITMSFFLWTSMMNSEVVKKSKSLWTQFWHRTSKLTQLYDEKVKKYSVFAWWTKYSPSLFIDLQKNSL